MKFSTRTRYALRLMVDLATAGRDGFVSLRDVSERQGISVKYLEQIASQLIRAGLLRSSRGAQGGYVLTREPAAYTAGDIIRAVDGEVAVVACLTSTPNPCRRASTCPTINFWQGLNHTIDAYLDATRLTDLVDGA
ncbi:MAG: Rrf2 family transcriptional regulator [Planctomycetes bacterium]|nr:Rrf2 family transcriptional regulator [Planctomycetota bacterium]